MNKCYAGFFAAFSVKVKMQNLNNVLQHKFVFAKQNAMTSLLAITLNTDTNLKFDVFQFNTVNFAIFCLKHVIQDMHNIATSMLAC